MSACGCDLEADGVRFAARELEEYRRRGLPVATRRLFDALVAHGVEGLTLLDIGGGIGAIHHELLRAGLRSVVDVDGSSTYIATARQEAERQGHAGQITYRHDDFVQVAGEIEPADVVTLIAVLCCYPEMEPLVRLSASRAGRLYGLIYPRSTWWMRAAAAAYAAMRITGSGPGYVHAERSVDAAVRAAGLVPRFDGSTWYWKVVLYGRDV